MEINQNKNRVNENALAIALIIFFVILVYLLTIGKISIPIWNKSESSEEIKRKHKRLVSHLDKQKALKLKLDKLFVKIYFLVRVIFIGLWMLLTYSLYHFELVEDLGEVLNYFQAIFLTIIALNFLVFGNLVNIKTYVNYVKRMVENRVYGKYINLDDKINDHENKLNELNLEMNSCGKVVIIN